MTSLRQRLTFTHALIGLIAVVTVAALTTALVLRSFDRLRTQASITAATDRLADFYDLHGDWRGVDVALRRQFAGPLAGVRPAARPHVQLLDEHSQIIFDSNRPRARGAVIPPIAGDNRPIVVGGRTVGTLIFVPGAAEQVTTATERDFLARLYLSVLGGSVLATLVALLVGLLITRSLTRPLRSMTLAAQGLAAGVTHTPLAVPADRELADLAHAFNAMAADLDKQERLRRQLVADIAHELRTPLSVLRLQVESIEDGVEQPTAAVMGSIGQEVGLLQRLVDDLRLLSLAEAGQISLAVERLDAQAALARTAAIYAPRARQQGIELRVAPASALPEVAADPQRLAQVLGNLVENALRYTPPGGVVTLRVAPDAPAQSAPLRTALPTLVSPPAVVFEVSDTGGGIAAADLPHLFDRFFRADRARSRETGGSGLGLAIVQRLTEAMGGSVAVESTIGSGTTFRVVLPAA